MGRSIVKIDEYYLEWSSVVDAPVTFGMPLEEFEEYYRARYGIDSLDGLADRMERVEKTGTSSRLDKNLEEFIASNRAGKNETCLTLEEIKDWYCIKKENPT